MAFRFTRPVLSFFRNVSYTPLRLLENGKVPQHPRYQMPRWRLTVQSTIPGLYCTSLAGTSASIMVVPLMPRGASVVRIISLSNVRIVHIRGSRQPGDLLAMLVHHRERQRKQRSRGGA